MTTHDNGTHHSDGDLDTADHAYTGIRGQIMRGERPGGQWLRESDLARDLGVSRTPVREALRRLAAEGLVRHERHRGVQVTQWELDDLDEIFDLRAVLEPWGCRLAASRGLANLDLLDALATRMDEAAAASEPQIDLITDLNNEFHQHVLRASGSSRLGALVASVVQVPVVWGTFSRYTPQAMRRSLAHHHEIVDALRAGDADWAESVMRAHVRAAWASVRRPLEPPPEASRGGPVTIGS